LKKKISDVDEKNHTTDTVMILIPGNFQRIAEGGEAEQFTILKFDAKSYVLNVAVYDVVGAEGDPPRVQGEADAEDNILKPPRSCIRRPS